MTTQRTVGSKASARHDKAALEKWAQRQLALAQRATTRAVREHLAAGRAVVFEKDGRLFVKAGLRAKARPLAAGELRSSNAVSAQRGSPRYVPAPKRKVRAKSR